MKTRTSVVAVGFVALTLTSAGAVELLQPIPLPDGGLGSKALGIVNVGAAGTAVAFVGQKNDATRLARPYVWGINQQTPADWNEVALAPLDPGDEGAVVLGHQYPNGVVIAVGVSGPAADSQTSATSRQAVLWVRPAGGAWSAAIPLAPGAASSEASAVDGTPMESLAEETVFVVGTVTEGGVTRPVAWSIGSDEFGKISLPTPSDRGGAALGFWLGSNDALGAAFSGYTLRADGSREPCLWRAQAPEFIHEAIALPKGHSGEARAIQHDGSTERVAVNVVTPRGARQAVVFEFLGGSVEGTGIRRRAPLPPLAGFAHSSAQGFVGSPVEGTGIRRSAPIVIGTSWNAAAEVVPTFWIRAPKGTWEAVPARRLLASDESFALRSLVRSNGGLAGQILPRPDAAPQGVAFLRTRRHAPEFVKIAAGKAIGTRPLADLTRLWRDDERSLLVTTFGRGERRTAAVELTYSSVFTTQDPTAELAKLRIVASAKSKVLGAAGALDVKAWRPATKDFVLLTTLTLTDVEQTFESDVVADVTQFVDAQDAALRLRLEFRPLIESPVALSLNEATVSGSAN